LKKAIATIRQAIHGKAELFRLGAAADEFFVLLNNWDLEEASALAERIRREIQSTDFPVIGRCLTVSVGVSTYPEPCSDWNQLRVSADRAAMMAKQLGKNRVVRYDRSISLVNSTIPSKDTGTS